MSPLSRPIATPTSLSEAERCDSADPIGHARRGFALPDGIVYLDGHSLGPPTHSARAKLQDAADNGWANGLIRSWNDASWIDLPQRLGARLARLIGAPPQDVIVTDSVSVNIFKLAAAALDLSPNRRLIVEDDDFPTDQYVAASLGAFTHTPLIRVRADETEAALRAGGVLIKSAVNYRTCAVTDMRALEHAAAASGALIVWDLSHAVGVLALDLTADGARLAVGCTYKYLNGGPGAPAFIYAQSALAQRLRTPIAGWFGHAAPFDFSSDYAPAPGVAQFAAGTPSILSCVALEGALDAFDALDMRDVEAKARALGQIWLNRAAARGLASPSPAGAHARGGHISLTHAHGYEIVQALIARGIIGDFRSPDTMRFGFSPLFLSYAEVWRAFDTLAEILESQNYLDPAFAVKQRVT